MKPEPIRALLAAALAAAAFPSAAQDLAGRSAAETTPPFGGEASRAYAEALRERLEARGLMGEGAIRTRPYEGARPHGKVLELLVDQVTVDGRDGAAIVKRNHAGEASRETLSREVMAGGRDRLASVTVMFRREAGYDPDNANWFWAKYTPEGELARTPQGRAQAGRVAKGADRGCISCHAGAPGGDYLFTDGLAVE